MSAKKVIPATEVTGQRKSVRYIALSTLAHLGLLTMIAAMPRPHIGSAGEPNANARGSTVMMDIANPDTAEMAQLGNGGEKEMTATQTALEARASALPVETALNNVPVKEAPKPITPPVIEKAPAPVAEKVEPAALPVKPSKTANKNIEAPKKSSSKIATKLPSKAGAAPVIEQEESLPEAVTWKATERAHEASLAQQAAEQLASDNAKETALAAAPTQAAQAPAADTAASDQPVSLAVSPAVSQADSGAPESESAQPASRRQAPSAIPITTQQFAPAAASAGSANGSATGSATGRGNIAAQLGAPSGTQFRNAEEMAEQPGNKMPGYPMQDRVNGHQGVVVLVGQVAQDGHVAKATIQKSSGSTAMDQASMTAFRNWKFAPGQEGYVYKSYRFNLTGEAQEVPARLAQ